MTRVLGMILCTNLKSTKANEETLAKRSEKRQYDTTLLLTKI